jgi:hypothetical protein
VFYRKFETLEIARRMPGQASKEEGFEGTNKEDVKAATCPHLIGGQQGGVLM